MKALMTTIALTTTLVAGSAIASTNSEAGLDIVLQGTFHHNTETLVIIDGPTMPGFSLDSEFYLGGN
ncbi:hypothetical protein [Amphritea sp. HPY]|uniref:hypothetical protein n=1 Tax=Amphritea sp. HPY TaxID=3421652 RepID=UPI003D7E47F1